MSNFHITTIIDNHVPSSPFYGEHGLSILIEHEDRKIMMDVGQSHLFAENAKNIGINIAEVTDLILSHGHYDHTSGLKTFFDLNSKANIYMHPDGLKNKLNVDKYIGIPIYLKETLAKKATMITKNTEIAKNIYIITNTTIYDKDLTNFNNMYVKENEISVIDTFEDELFIAIIKDNQVSVLTGCAHRGITNILKTAKNLFNLPINLVFGGLHLRSSGENRRQSIIKKINDIGINKIITNHCTGLLAFHEIKTKFKEKAFYGYIGEKFSF